MINKAKRDGILRCAQEMTLYCPRCDRRITPSHRCLSRRHFFGMLAAGVAALLTPKPALPTYDLLASGNIGASLRAGDRLGLTFTGSARAITGLHPAIWGATLRLDRTGEEKFMTGPYSGGPLFIATEPCIISDAKLLVGDTVHRVPVEITGTADYLRRKAEGA